MAQHELARACSCKSGEAITTSKANTRRGWRISSFPALEVLRTVQELSKEGCSTHIPSLDVSQAFSDRSRDRQKQYLNDRGFRILNALDQLAKRHQTKPATLALAWLMARRSITAPIASATSLEQFNDLVAARRLELDTQAIELLNRASAN